MKKRLLYSLFITIFIYLIFLTSFVTVLYFTKDSFTKPPQKKEKRLKISLKEYKIPQKKLHGQINKRPKPTPIAPPMPKGSQLKKLTKPPLPKYNPKKPKKQPKLNPPTPKPQKKEEPVKKKEPLPPTSKKPLLSFKEKKSLDQNQTKPKKKRSSNPLYALLSEDHSDEEIEQQQKSSTASSGIMQDIKKLYGVDFGKLSPGQQKYILDNQEIMRRITQQVLIRVARVNLPRDLRVNATNIIEFYLHPDGSMSDFKFLKKSGYYILDETTKETIEYAYSKYPHPTEKTLIRYKVFYNLASY